MTVWINSRMLCNLEIFDKYWLWGSADDSEGPDHPVDGCIRNNTTNLLDQEAIGGMKVTR